MKKSDIYKLAILSVMDAYRNGTTTADDVVDTLMELCDSRSSALWQEEREEDD